MSVRFIYNKNNWKINKQYEQISKFFPKQTNTNTEIVKYNIYFDTISEYEYNNFKSLFNILIVNEEYVNHKYLIRSNYKDEPLIKLSNIVDFYWCTTLYSYNELISMHISKKKLLYLNNVIDSNIIQLVNVKQYILFEIDKYCSLENNILLETWFKYFLNIDRNVNLIIIYHYYYDRLVYLFSQLTNIEIKNKIDTYYYKNIILSNDKSILNNYTIFASIIHCSKYYLTTNLTDNIINGRIIIAQNNEITQEYFANKYIYLYDSFNDIKDCIDKLLNENLKTIIDYPIVLKKNLINYNKNLKLIKDFIGPSNEKHNNISIETPNIVNTSDRYSKESVEKTALSHKAIIPTIINIDNMFKNKNINLKNYYRFIKNTPNKTDFGYCTSIFLNNSYLPGILASGYSLKMNTKNNIICFVQDKPYYYNNVLVSQGLNKHDIEMISKIYDVIIGVDLIVNNNFTKTDEKHINMKFYCSKLICYGFIYYKKLIYYDASTLITKNIDYFFEQYNFSRYFNVEKYLYCGRGVHGAFLFIIPKSYYINKLRYLLDNNIINKQKNWHSYFTDDEDHTYYTIYPNWDKNLLDNKILENNWHRMPYINEYKLTDTSIQFYVYHKPFRFNNNDKEEYNFFIINHDCYLDWDIIVLQLITKYPILKKYFQYIKTFRNTLFGDNINNYI